MRSGITYSDLCGQGYSELDPTILCTGAIENQFSLTIPVRKKKFRGKRIADSG